MATYKIDLSSIVSEISEVYFLVIELRHQEVERKIYTPYYLSEKNFDPFLEKAVVSPESSLPEKKVNEINQYLSGEVRKIQKIITRMDAVKSDYTVYDILEEYRDEKFSDLFLNYVDEQVLARSIQRRKTDLYKALVSRMMGFHGYQRPLCFHEITGRWLCEFRTYLSFSGYSESAVDSCTRILHRICMTARKDKVYTVLPDPFQVRYRKQEEGDVLTQGDFNRIKEADLRFSPEMELARDLFVFCYLTRGMSFKDVAHLKKKDLRQGVIRYHRNQVRKNLCGVKITPELQSIMDRYQTPGEYVFPIFSQTTINLHDQYRMKLRRHNGLLKEMAAALDLSCTLSYRKAMIRPQRDPDDKNIKISVSMGTQKTVDLLCPLTADIKQSVMAVLEQLIDDKAFAV